jgi:hypothetical protein
MREIMVVVVVIAGITAVLYILAFLVALALVIGLFAGLIWAGRRGWEMWRGSRAVPEVDPDEVQTRIRELEHEVLPGPWDHDPCPWCRLERAYAGAGSGGRDQANPRHAA